MNRRKVYYTPRDLSRIIASYCPIDATRILEPAVGQGNLLQALTETRNSRKSRVDCVDIDCDALALVDKRFGDSFGGGVHPTCSDFLAAEFAEEKIYDFVLMNPPYGRSNDELVKHYCRRIGLPRYNFEGAFLSRAIELLRPGGLIAAVLPISVLNGQIFVAIRKQSQNFLRWRLCHELPNRTFSGTEARVAIVVLEKSKSQENREPMRLLNHSLESPVGVQISHRSAQEGISYRLDYTHYDAQNLLNRLAHRTQSYMWQTLGDFCSIDRGVWAPNKRSTRILHTGDRAGPIWCYGRRKAGKEIRAKERVRWGDLLAVRVGRDLANSFGVYVGQEEIPFSDCVYRIRLRTQSPLRVLLAVRVVLGIHELGSAFELGVAAKYWTVNQIENLRIPVALADQYPLEFYQYVTSLSIGQIETAMEIEDSLRLRLLEFMKA